MGTGKEQKTRIQKFGTFPILCHIQAFLCTDFGQRRHERSYKFLISLPNMGQSGKEKNDLLNCSSLFQYVTLIMCYLIQFWNLKEFIAYDKFVNAYFFEACNSCIYFIIIEIKAGIILFKFQFAAYFIGHYTSVPRTKIISQVQTENP